jgi:hypothetical protein
VPTAETRPRLDEGARRIRDERGAPRQVAHPRVAPPAFARSGRRGITSARSTRADQRRADAGETARPMPSGALLAAQMPA